MTALLIFSCIMLICTAFGVRICGIKKQTIENLVLSSCIGLAVLSYLVLFAGLIGWLYQWVFIVILLALCSFSFRELVEIYNYCLAKARVLAGLFPGLLDRTLIFAFLAVFFLTLIRALAPEIGNDALAYHLAHPKIFAGSHAIKAIEYSRESLWPYFSEMLFTLGILLHGPALAKLFAFAAALILALAIYAFGAKNFGRGCGILASTVFFLTPAIFTQAGYAYIDIMLALYAFMSLYFLCAWAEKGKTGDIILSGIFCGITMSIKYLGLYLFISLSAVFIYSFIRQKKSILKAFIIFAALGFAVCAVWYLKSYLITGNPFYPFFNKYFANAWENPIGVTCGMAKSLKNFILMPWNITMHPKTFAGEQLGIIYLMFLPFVLLSRQIRNYTVQLITVFTLIFIFSWFLTFQVTRYLFPVLPVFSILTAISILEIVRYRKVKRFVFFIFFAALTSSIALAFYHAKDAARVVFGLEPEAAYLGKKERSYAISSYINNNTERDAKIFTIEPRIYYIDRNVIYADGYLEENMLKNANFDELADILRNDGFNYILLAQQKPFDKNDDRISSGKIKAVYQSDFIEHTDEDRWYALLKL